MAVTQWWQLRNSEQRAQLLEQREEDRLKHRPDSLEDFEDPEPDDYFWYLLVLIVLLGAAYYLTGEWMTGWLIE